jgi:hypothetical protein
VASSASPAPAAPGQVAGQPAETVAVTALAEGVQEGTPQRFRFAVLVYGRAHRFHPGFEASQAGLLQRRTHMLGPQPRQSVSAGFAPQRRRRQPGSDLGAAALQPVREGSYRRPGAPVQGRRVAGIGTVDDVQGQVCVGGV